MNKPNIFIGSSSEALPYAEEIKQLLNEEVESTIWNEDLFSTGEDHLTSLLRFIRAFDFAILIMTPDDLSEMRKEASVVPRDNVIFELGLFMGALGRRRVFPLIVSKIDCKLRLPSDLAGQNMIYLQSGITKLLKEAKQELGKLRGIIKQRYLDEAEFQLLPSTGIAVSYFYNFLLPVCKLLTEQAKVTTKDDKLPLIYKDFKFQILIPRKLREANPYGAKHHTQQRRLRCVEVENLRGHRPYPFFTEAEIGNDTELVFSDFPTALKASDEAIDHITNNAYLSGGSYREAFDKKELANFKKTLELLLINNEEAISFRDKILFIEVS